jgi:anti-sigma B factor antagonist
VNPDLLSDVLTGAVADLDGRVVYRLDGELDLSGTDALIARIRDLAGADGGGVMILDLSRVTFIDSSGLHAMVKLTRQMQAGGARLVLARPHPSVARLIDLTGLGTELAIAP